MEQSSFGSRRQDEPDFNFKEWSLKARISRENTNSRRFSASNLKSFREDANKSCRSNLTISSTASSPGYITKDEIDPSTYSFTNALKALQAKTMYTWEYSSPDGLTLNSKWNDAEKYISNPLSGEVPLECLSMKTLSGRSMRSLTSRITMSAPLIYPSHLQQFQAKNKINEHENEAITIQEKKRGTTRDVGTQSTPVDLSSSSPSPTHTPSIKESSVKHNVGKDGDSPLFSGKLTAEKEVEMKETIEEEYTERNEEGEEGEGEGEEEMMMCVCISLKDLWMKRKQRDKHKKPNKP